MSMTICPGSRAKDTLSTAGRSAPSYCTVRRSTSSAYMQATPTCGIVRDERCSSLDGCDYHTIGGQPIVCVVIRTIDKGLTLDHNITESRCSQERAYTLRAVQSFSIGPVPQHTTGFGQHQFPYADDVLRQFAFPTDHDIVGGFMPGFSTKMAQGRVTINDIKQKASPRGEQTGYFR